MAPAHTCKKKKELRQFLAILTSRVVSYPYLSVSSTKIVGKAGEGRGEGKVFLQCVKILAYSVEKARVPCRSVTLRTIN